MNNSKKDVYQNIKYRIISKNLKSGEILNERELMEHYNIGRTPLREIFIELVREGLVQKFPRSGTIVSPMDYNKLKEACEVRRPIERTAGELAAERMNPEQLKQFHKIIVTIEKNSKTATAEFLINLDTELHNLIYEATCNETLKSIIHNLHSFTLRYWFEPSFANNLEYIDIGQWNKIYDAVKNREVKKTGQLLVDHIDRSLKALKEHI